MRLNALSLEYFRNYLSARAEFHPGMNIICGDNAQGKTNLLEGISYLAGARSHRARYDRELIMFGIQHGFLTGELECRGRDFNVEITLNAGHGMNYHSHENRDEVWTVISGTGRAILDGRAQPVKAGDILTMKAGCKHTILADTELKVIEVQLGKAISVEDKQKYPMPQA